MQTTLGQGIKPEDGCMTDSLPANIVTAGDQMRIIEDLQGAGLPSAPGSAAMPLASPHPHGHHGSSNPLLDLMPLGSSLPSSGHGPLHARESLASTSPSPFQNLMVPPPARTPLQHVSQNGFTSMAASHAAHVAFSLHPQHGHLAHDASTTPAPIYPMTSLEARAQGMMPGRAPLARDSDRPTFTASLVGSNGKSPAFEGAFARMAPAAFSFHAPAAAPSDPQQHTVTRASFQQVHSPAETMLPTASGTTAGTALGAASVNVAPHVMQMSDKVRRAASMGCVLSKASMVLNAQQRQQQHRLQQQLQQQLLKSPGAAAQQLLPIPGYHMQPGAQHSAAGLAASILQQANGSLPSLAEISHGTAGTLAQAALASSANANVSLQRTATPTPTVNARPVQAFPGTQTVQTLHGSTPAQAAASQQPAGLQPRNANSPMISVPGSAPLPPFMDQAAQGSMGLPARKAKEQLLERSRDYCRQQAAFAGSKQKASQVHAQVSYTECDRICKLP